MESTNDLIGQTLLRRYRVEAFIGRGGMADVYRARDLRHEQLVALKVLREDLIHDPVVLRRFRREASVLDPLRHPNIVRYYGLEEGPNLAFLVVEFIYGESLRRELGRLARPLTPAQAASVLEPVCDALQYAHDQGVLHCDIKPANILIERGGRIVLVDFGIARWAESATTTFAGAGTPAYMSPEQCRGTGITCLSDIYSLSVTLYEMLTLDRPFVGDTAPPDSTLAEKVRWEHLHTAPPNPRSLNRNIPVAVEGMVLKGLSKEPEGRQQTPQQFYQELVLAGVQPDRTVAWSAQETLLPARQPGQRPVVPQAYTPAVNTAPALPEVRPQRGPVFAALGIAAGMLLIIVFALFLSRSTSFPGMAVVPATATFTPTVTMTPSSTATASSAPTLTPMPSPTEVVVVLPSLTPTPSPPPSTVYIEYILDASNSMMQSLGGSKTKLEIVRTALAQHWTGLQPQPNLGLRAFGHRRSAVDSSSCLDTEQLAPVVQGQVGYLISLVDNLTAQGMSPLGQTLVEASGDFTLTPERANALILIADGADNCGGDPCQTVKTHHEVGIRYPIYVVGLAVDETARQELVCIAQTSGGLYRNAGSEAELVQALDEFVHEIAANAP
jgi:serine/threonine protein kinase